MKAILRFLDIEEGEGARVGLLLVMSFFMGVFIACFSVASQSLFLSIFSPKDDLPTALFLSGAFGLAATITYNFFQNRIPFVFLSTLTLLAVGGITAFMEFGAAFFPAENDIYFYGFVAFFPLAFLVPLIFWATFNRLFNLRQAKRLLGSVDYGMMIAQLLAFFLIPIYLAVTGYKEDTLYTIGLVSISVFIVLFIYVYFKHVTKQRTFREERRAYRKLTAAAFVSNRYIRFMSIFVIVSVTAVYFMDYSFLNVTTGYIQGDGLAEFIAYFEMTIVIFGLLVDQLATDRIIKEYGMRVALLINPLLIIGFTSAAVALGYFFGYSPNSQGFVIFFMAIAVGRLLLMSLREALDAPTFKQYLLPIESEIRIDVQTKIEGIISSTAILAAGGMIILLNNAGLDLIYISVATLPVLLIWWYATNKMHASYRDTLQSSLAKGKEKAALKKEKEYALTSLLEKEVNSVAEEKVIYGLKLMEKLEPALFENAIIRLIENESRRIKAFALEKVESLGLQGEAKSEMRSLAQSAISETEDSDLLSISPDKLVKLSKSNKQADRILAAKLLRKLISNRTIFVLLELLRDVDQKVRFEALHTARRVKRPETWPVLIELLGSPTYSHHAMAALKECGENALGTLEAAFHKSGQTDIVMLRIVQVMAKIGGPHALQLLWKKADYPDKRIVKQILYSLRYINYKATGREARDVIGLLETEMGKTIWNLAAIHELPEVPEFHFLREALKEEVEQNYDQLFMLLSILYDPNSVQLVRDNIESGDPDNIAFAMELLDLFIDQELKPKILPLLDESDTSDKLKALQLHFPRESYEPIQVVNYILNRDFNFNNRWTKVCAIHASAYMKDFRISRGLVAQMFNTDKLLQETAAWVVYNKDKAAYEAITERLPAKDKKFLDGAIENNQLLDGLDDGFFLFIEMVMFIKESAVFKGVAGLLVSDLADKISPLDLDFGERVRFNPDDPNTPVMIVAHGEVKLMGQNGIISVLRKGDVYGEIFQEGLAEKVTAVEASERAVVFKIDLMDFYFVLANHHELVQGLIKNITEERSDKTLQPT